MTENTDTQNGQTSNIENEIIESQNHYFDWAATSPEDPQILKESLEIALKCWGNPSSIHKLGKEAKKILEEARKNAAKTLGVKENQIYFTSGGTESDHIPLLSLLKKADKGRIIISAIEHSALKEQCESLKKCGFEIVTVNPDKNGFMSPQSIIEKLTSDTLFVTVMAVNNETGCIQNIYEIADALTQATQGKRRPHFHVDCVQAAGKVPLNLSHKGIDSAALSSHKICGPRGIGILYLSKEINPFLTGGGQENNIRSGTENLFGAVAFSKVLEKYYLKGGESLPLAPEKTVSSQSSATVSSSATPSSGDTPQRPESTSNKYERFYSQIEWTSSFIEKLKTIKNCTLVPELRADTSSENQKKYSQWVIQAAFKGIPGNVMVRALDAKGFYISTGSACSAKKQSRPILAAMGSSRDIQDTAVRFSFGPLTTQKAMDELFEAIKEVCADFS